MSDEFGPPMSRKRLAYILKQLIVSFIIIAMIAVYIWLP